MEEFDIINPSGGAIFPKILPREAFPAKPDPEMVRWHDNVSKRLEIEYRSAKKSKPSSHRSSPPTTSNNRRVITALEEPTEDEAEDYFAPRHPGKSHRPKAASRPSSPSHESFSLYPQPQPQPQPRTVPDHIVVPANYRASSKPRPAIKSVDLRTRDNRSQSFTHQKPVSPPRPRKGRSTTPSGPRRVRGLSLSDNSENSEVSDVEGFSKAQVYGHYDDEEEEEEEEEEDDDDEEDYAPPRHDRFLSPHHHHVRRHSHDAAYPPTPRLRESPPRHQVPDSEEEYSPESKITCDPHYSYISPLQVIKPGPPRQYHSYQEDDFPGRVASTRKSKTSTVRFQEYVIDDAENFSSAPPSPGGRSRRRRPSYSNNNHYYPNNREKGSGHRHWVQRLEKDVGPPLHSKRKGSVGNGSRSGSSTDRARALNGGGKLLPAYAGQPVISRRYITPPSSLHGSMPFEMDLSDENRRGRRSRWD